ncbi:hypothetical protein [Sphingopyxis sp. NJF-3]
MKYVEVVEWSAKDGGVHFTMKDEDQALHRFEVGAECSAILAGALVAEFEKLDGPEREAQLLRPVGMQTGKTEQGEPMLFMTLRGGAELPFVFKRESLDVLISELQKLKALIEPGAQIHWR